MLYSFKKKYLILCNLIYYFRKIKRYIILQLHDDKVININNIDKIL